MSMDADTAYIAPKNWTSFQHYKDRSPVWIKLHKSILDNYDYQCLPIASKALAPMLWLLASEYEDGKIPADLNRIAFRVRITIADLQDALIPLIDNGFFVCYQGASEVLAKCLPREEKRREEKEIPSPAKEKPKALALTRFDEFWVLYPRKVEKAEAKKVWAKLKLDTVADAVIAGAKRYAAEVSDKDQQYTKHATTWLNRRCWEDEPEATKPGMTKTQYGYVPEWMAQGEVL